MKVALLAGLCLAVASPASAATITFEDGTFAFAFQSSTAKVWRTGDFSVATSLDGDIANGVISDSQVSITYQPRGLVDLLSFDVRGTGELEFRSAAATVVVDDIVPTVFNLTGDWQTITLDPASVGFFFRLTSDATFEADNFVFNDPVPEPETWAMMILGFGVVGGALRASTRNRAEARASAA